MTTIIIILILLLGISIWFNLFGYFKPHKRKKSGRKHHNTVSDSVGTEIVEIFEPYRNYMEKSMEKQMSETVDRLHKQDKQITDIKYGRYKVFYGWTQKVRIYWRKK